MNVTLYGYSVKEQQENWFTLGPWWLGKTADIRDGKIILESGLFDKSDMARMAHLGWKYIGRSTWCYIKPADGDLASYLARNGVMFHRSIGRLLRKAEGAASERQAA